MNKLPHLFVAVLILLSHACQISPLDNSTESRFHLTAIPQTKITISMRHLTEWEMEKVNQVGWSSDSNRIFVVGKEESSTAGVYAFDAINHTRLWFKASESASKLAISPNGRMGVVYGDRLEFWDLEGGNKISEYGSNTYKDIQFFDDSSIIVGESQTLRSGPYTTKVSLLTTDTKKRKDLFETEGWIRKVSISPDRQHLLIAVGKRNAGSSNAVIVWSIKEPKIICEFPGFNGAFIANSEELVISDRDQGIRLGDLSSCKLHKLTDVNVDPLSMDVDKEGQWLAYTNDTTKEVEVWDLGKQKKIYSLRGYAGNIIFSRDGKKLLIIENANGMRPSKISVWEIEG